MLSLIIDTSTERGFAAFFDGQSLVFQASFPFGLNNSKYLIPEIERGFQFLGKKGEDLDYVAVGIGPGSYTGIRVGAITAKTMAYALKKPLVTFCSLEAFLPSSDGNFAAILDAKIGGAYVFKGITADGSSKNLDVVNIFPLEELGEYLKDTQYLITPHAESIKKKLEQIYPDNSWKWEENEPNALHLANLCREKWKKREYADCGKIELLYLRKTQAEIELQKRIM